MAGYYIDQKIIRHGKIDDLNLDQLYERMKTIKEKNERILKAKEFLAEESSEESGSDYKEQTVKKLPSTHKKSDPDSTS